MAVDSGKVTDTERLTAFPPFAFAAKTRMRIKKNAQALDHFTAFDINTPLTLLEQANFRIRSRKAPDFRRIYTRRRPVDARISEGGNFRVLELF